MMKRFILSALLCLAAVTATADTRGGLMKATEMWAPIDARVAGNRAEIILPQNRITDRMYISVITAGVCMGQLSSPDILNGVSEIAILNKHAHQGYVLEGGKELCDQLNKAPLGKSKDLMVLGSTHLH